MFKKTHIHSFNNRLVGEVTVTLEFFLNFSDSIRIAVLEQTLQGVRKLY